MSIRHDKTGSECVKRVHGSNGVVGLDYETLSGSLDVALTEVCVGNRCVTMNAYQLIDLRNAINERLASLHVME